MADETQELGLDITAQDVTQNAFASVNAGMDGVVGKAGEVKDAAEGMGIQSVAHIGHMAHGFENLGATMEGGSISMRSLAAVVQGGMAAIECSYCITEAGEIFTSLWSLQCKFDKDIYITHTMSPLLDCF